VAYSPIKKKVVADSLPNQNAYIARGTLDALLAASLRMYCLPPHDVGPLGKTHLIVAVPELLITVVTQPQATAFLHLPPSQTGRGASPDAPPCWWWGQRQLGWRCGWQKSSCDAHKAQISEELPFTALVS
jgi:hypothetical protein